jgi:hypothetical protein
MHPLLRGFVNRWLGTKPFYRTAAAPLPGYTWAMDARISINDPYRFIYIRVPKAANTMLSHTLFQHAHGVSAHDNRQAKNAFRHPSHLRRDEIAHVIGQYYCFIVVRNPYERVFSAYWSKVRSNSMKKKRYRDTVRRRAGGAGDAPISFAAFCRYLDAGGLYDDPHWLPQACYATTLGVDNIDFVGSVENLHDDLQTVFGAIFPDHDAIKFSNRSGSRNNSSAFARDYYDRECLEIVQRLYARDFELFGYATDPDAMASPPGAG